VYFIMQQSEPTSLDPPLVEPAKPTVDSFVKILTASDTSTHGGFSVLRKHATECLPSLVNAFIFPSSFYRVWAFLS
jgi:hypothetical protein